MNRHSRLLFERAWRANGSLRLNLIAPVAQWTLPVGIVYEPAYQTLMNGTTPVAPNAYWSTTTMPYIPLSRSQTTLAMIMSGVLSDGTAEIEVWSESSSALDSAFGLQLNGYVYRIASRSPTGSSGSLRLVLDRKR